MLSPNCFKIKHNVSDDGIVSVLMIFLLFRVGYALIAKRSVNRPDYVTNVKVIHSISENDATDVN